MFFDKSFSLYICNRGSWDYNNNHRNRNYQNHLSFQNFDYKPYNPSFLAERLKQKRISQDSKDGKKEHKTDDRQRKEGYR